MSDILAGITGTATMREILLQYDNNFSETE